MACERLKKKIEKKMSDSSNDNLSYESTKLSITINNEMLSSFQNTIRSNYENNLNKTCSYIELQKLNPHLEKLDEDILYHIALGNKSHDLQKMFKDVKFIVMGGTPRRMEQFAYFIMNEIGYEIEPGTILNDISKHSHRYAMFKVGPILSVSHGMGMPSIGILLHELIKLVHYAGIKDPTFIRIGTCGGFGKKGGTVVVSEEVVNDYMKSVYELSILGVNIQFPALLNKDIANEIMSFSQSQDNFETVTGKTYCTDHFYEGSGRSDGAICEFSESESKNYYLSLQNNNVVNVEMESLAFAALTCRAGIKSAIICVILSDRLETNQIKQTKEVLDEWQTRPQKLLARYIKSSLSKSGITVRSAMKVKETTVHDHLSKSVRSSQSDAFPPCVPLCSNENKIKTETKLMSSADKLSSSKLPAVVKSSTKTNLTMLEKSCNTKTGIPVDVKTTTFKSEIYKPGEKCPATCSSSDEIGKDMVKRSSLDSFTTPLKMSETSKKSEDPVSTKLANMQSDLFKYSEISKNKGKFPPCSPCSSLSSTMKTFSALSENIQSDPLKSSGLSKGGGNFPPCSSCSSSVKSTKTSSTTSSDMQSNVKSSDPTKVSGKSPPCFPCSSSNKSFKMSTGPSKNMRSDVKPSEPTKFSETSSTCFPCTSSAKTTKISSTSSTTMRSDFSKSSGSSEVGEKSITCSPCSSMTKSSKLSASSGMSTKSIGTTKTDEKPCAPLKCANLMERKKEVNVHSKSSSIGSKKTSETSASCAALGCSDFAKQTTTKKEVNVQSSNTSSKSNSVGSKKEVPITSKTSETSAFCAALRCSDFAKDLTKTLKTEIKTTPSANLQSKVDQQKSEKSSSYDCVSKCTSAMETVKRNVSENKTEPWRSCYAACGGSSNKPEMSSKNLQTPDTQKSETTKPAISSDSKKSVYRQCLKLPSCGTDSAGGATTKFETPIQENVKGAGMKTDGKIPCCLGKSEDIRSPKTCTGSAGGATTKFETPIQEKVKGVGMKTDGKIPCCLGKSEDIRSPKTCAADKDYFSERQQQELSAESSPVIVKGIMVPHEVDNPNQLGPCCTKDMIKPSPKPVTVERFGPCCVENRKNSSSPEECIDHQNIKMESVEETNMKTSTTEQRLPFNNGCPLHIKMPCNLRLYSDDLLPRGESQKPVMSSPETPDSNKTKEGPLFRTSTPMPSSMAMQSDTPPCCYKFQTLSTKLSVESNKFSESPTPCSICKKYQENKNQTSVSTSSESQPEVVKCFHKLKRLKEECEGYE